MIKANSEVLVLLANAGLRPAFDQLMAQERQAILAAIRQVTPPHEVEDVYQVVLVHLWQNTAKYETHNFKAWLKKVVRNKAIDEARKRRAQAHAEITGVPLDQIDPRTLGPDPMVEKTKEAIATLTKREQEMVGLHYGPTSYSYAEIAGRLGISDRTVGTLLQRARRKVKAYVTTVE